MSENKSDNNPFVINSLTREASDLARGIQYEQQCELARLARAIRKAKAEGKEPDAAVIAEAKRLGERAAQARKEAKEALARASEARRIACFLVKPKVAPPAPFILPLKPPPSKKDED